MIILFEISDIFLAHTLSFWKSMFISDNTDEYIFIILDFRISKEGSEKYSIPQNITEMVMIRNKYSIYLISIPPPFDDHPPQSKLDDES